MDGFPSGQRGQTVNLLQFASVVRIHLCPFSFQEINYYRGMEQSGSSSGSKPEGHRFKSYSRNSNFNIVFAQLAQLVEQRTENPRVSGSIPELGIQKKNMGY